MSGEPSAARELAEIRARWLDEALVGLRRDARVVGVGLVGSLGRGEADDWSDVDLLVVVDDGEGRFVDPLPDRLWAGAELVVAGRHNAPAGASSVGTVYVRSGLPLGVDWYVHPVSLAAWPSDCVVVHQVTQLARVDETFSVRNSQGPRQRSSPKSPDEVRQARLAMVPIAGKYIARRSPRVVPMLELLGAPTLAAGAGPADQLQALQDILARLSMGAPPRLADAIASYLDLVESAVVRGTGPPPRAGPACTRPDPLGPPLPHRP